MRLTGFHNNGAVRLDRNDCTVRALATVTKKDYVEVFHTLAAAGRRPNKGFFIYDWLRQNKFCVLGHQFTPTNLGVRGTFLVGNQGHVWAVINGVMHDSWGQGRGRRYKYCYLVSKLEPGEAQPTAAEQRAAALVAAALAD